MFKKLHYYSLFLMIFYLIYLQVHFYFLNYDYTKEVFDLLNLYKRICIFYGSTSLLYIYFHKSIPETSLIFSIYLSTQQLIFFLLNELSIMINYLIPSQYFLEFQISVDCLSLLITLILIYNLNNNNPYYIGKIKQ
jgi:hypothetical protein